MSTFEEANVHPMAGDMEKIFQLSLDLICIAGVDGYFKKLNPAFTRVLGYSEKELLETPFIEFIHPDDRERTMKEVETQLQGSPTLYFENRYLHKDGSVRWLAWNAHAAAEEGLLYAIARDITGQKRKEENFSFEMRELREVVESNTDIFYIYNVEGKLVKWNRAMENLTGLSPQELALKPAMQCIYEGDRQLVSQKIREIFEKGFTMVEARFIGADGTPVPYLFNGYVLTDADGAVTGFAGAGRDISGIKQAEAALRESEGRFRALIETADDTVLLTDMKFNRIYENEASWASLGYTREEWKEQGSFWGRIHPDDIATIMEKSVELLNKGTVSSKYRIRHKDGRYITRFAKSKAVYTDGKPTGIISILRDITDMEQAVEPLRQSEILMTTAQRMAHIGGWEHDVEKQSMVWTDEVYRIHDILPEDIPPGSIDHIARSVECHDPADRPVIQAAFRKCVEEGIPYDMEFPFTSAKGHRMFIRTAGYPVFGKGKNVGITGAVGLFMDITERKEADNVFKAIVEGTSSVVGEQFFRSLVQHLAQAMHVRFAFVAEMEDLHTARTIAFWTGGKIGENFSYDIRRTPCENVVGKKLRAYPENVDNLFPLDSWLKDNGVKSYMAIPLLNSAGACFGHMGIMDDKPIFDVNRHIDVLNIFAVRAANELERKEAEKKLKAAKEAAEAATLLKDKFVSLVAHDLRSPLATISMMLNVTAAGLKKARHDESAEMLAKVNGMCETMMEMTVNLLDAAKLQSGDMRLNRKMCDIKNICDAVISDLNYLAAKKGIALKSEIPHHARFHVDRILFQRVVHNLVINAVKFSNSGGVVTLSLPAGNGKQLAVKDTGTGIHESLVPDLFKYEVKTTTTGTSGERGTGFGLPMSMDIIKAHGGTIRATSQMGEGSTFFIEVPDIKPMVLVVDDDEKTVFILSKYLENMGAGVLTAKNGNEALVSVQNGDPVLVITDLAMPGVDGLALLQNLKNSAIYSHIPVIIITGNRSIGIRQTAFENHADDFITKPLSEPDFIPRIGRFIAG